jgi:hypothetical protein
MGPLLVLSADLDVNRAAALTRSRPHVESGDVARSPIATIPMAIAVTSDILSDKRLAGEAPGRCAVGSSRPPETLSIGIDPRHATGPRAREEEAAIGWR